MADYKVWRNVLSIPDNHHQQAEVIVAAKSRAAAARAFMCSDHDMKSYGTETGNAVAIATAMAAVGIVFWKPLDSTIGYMHRSCQIINQQDLDRASENGRRAAAIEAAKKAGKSVWVPYKYGAGARLTLPGGINLNYGYETKEAGHKVTMGDLTLKQRYPDARDAKIQAVAFARLTLEKALAALPTDAELEEFYR